jgi:hypothetical protein
MATIIVLIDMNSALRAGLRRIPIGQRITAASGIANILHPVTQL